MSYGLITELLPDQLQVLLVADKTVIPDSLLESLKALHLHPIISDPGQEISADSLAQAYKVIWVIPQFARHLSQTLETQLCQQLQPQQAKLLVVTTLGTGTLDHRPQFADWAKTTQREQEFIAKLQALLPEAKLVVGTDVIVSAKELGLGVLNFLVSQVAQGKILDPQLNFFPQTWPAFLENIPALLVKKTSPQSLIKGKKSETTVWSKILQLHLQRLTGELPHLESVTVSPTPVPDFESSISVTIEKPEDLVMLVVEKAKSVPRSATLPPTLNSTLPYPIRKPLASSPVVPVQRPAILNSSTSLSTPQVKTSVEALTTPPAVLALTTPAESPVATVKNEKTNISKVALATSSDIAHAPVPAQVSTQPDQAKSKTEANSVVPLAEKHRVPEKNSTQPASAGADPAPTQELEAELQKLFQSYRSDHKVKQVKQVAETKTVTKKKSLRKQKFFWVGLALIVLVAGGGALFGTWTLSSGQLRKSLIQTANASTTSAKLELPDSFSFWFKVAQGQSHALSFLPAAWQAEQTQVVQAANSLAQYQTASQAFDQTATKVFLAMTNRYPVEVSSLLPKLTAQGESTFTHLSETQAYLKQISAFQPASEQKILSSFENMLIDKKKELTPLQQLQPFLPQLLGLEGKKTYAIVLQNHQELRPLGGVIQAVAYVTLDKGVITDTQVKAISAMKSTTATPSATPDMARFLGSKTVTFPNSAWSPDAPTSADQVIKYLEQDTQKNVDGIWFVNTLALSDWLRTVGPLDIPEFGEVITHQNLLERLESHSELQIPGQNQPDFSSLLLQALLKKTMVLPQEKTPTLARVWFELLNTKQAALVVRQEEAQATLRAIGWSGSLIEPACPTPLQQERCMVDTVAQVESNVGQNKANIYLERQVSHQVSILSDAIEHVHTLSLKNTATSNAWPRGSYKAYIRLYVDPKARLEAIKVNGQNLPTEQTVISFENNRQVFGAYVEVPVQTTLALQYEYFLPTQQSLPFSYALFTQFQPGIETPEYQVSVNSGSFKPVLLAPQATVAGTTATFKSPTDLQSLVGVRY